MAATRQLLFLHTQSAHSLAKRNLGTLGQAKQHGETVDGSVSGPPPHHGRGEDLRSR